jgi:hypothetical protein
VYFLMQILRTVTIGLVLSLGLCLSAQATVIQIATLDRLAEQADLIVEGKVLSAKGHLVSGHIETTVRLQVDKRFKGDDPGEELVLTQLGGTIEEPLPLGQAVPGLPAFNHDENVILFLSTKPKDVSPALKQKALEQNGGKLPALWTSPKVVGGFQGKYNVYIDPATKGRMVIRQSAIAPQGIDPEQMPPEFQAALAESVAVAGKPGSDSLPDGKTLAVPAPETALTYDEFTGKLETLLEQEKDNGETDSAAESAAAPSEEEAATADPAPTAP